MNGKLVPGRRKKNLHKNINIRNNSSYINNYIRHVQLREINKNHQNEKRKKRRIERRNLEIEETTKLNEIKKTHKKITTKLTEN